MPDAFLDGPTLTLSADGRREPVCDRYEAGWKAGTPPPLDDLLGEVAAAERPALLHALLLIEQSYQTGPAPGPDEYRARFPAYAGLFRDPPPPPPGCIDPAAAPPAIPKYELAGVIGEGGMGVVYRGRHRKLGHAVAIKMVKASPAGGADRLARFEREARAVARLTHENVVRVYDFGRAAGRPYLVMEFVEGRTLGAALAKTPADPAWAAGVVARLARAMHYVHGRGVVHRDLKPANVLLTPDGTPKVTDFGLAKVLTADDPDLTHTWDVLGTPNYMSPEQARGEAAVGSAADVYGLGGLLYECLTGRPPFVAASPFLTIQQVLNDDPDRPTAVAPGVPTALEWVCLKCLAKDPAARYATAADLAADLDRFLAGDAVLAAPAGDPERDARWARRIGYEVLRAGAATGWARAYRAERAGLGYTRTVKVCAGPVGTPAHAALKREAEVLADLASPYVVRFHECGEEAGRPYLILEDVEGGRPPDPGPLPDRRVAELGLMMALGLQAVHDRGFVHGALHPGAVAVGTDGRVRIGDFAMARRIGTPGDPVPDWVPAVYLASEAVAEGRAQPASDFYSLGVILYEFIAGAPPTGRPRLPSSTDPALAAVVSRCLRKRPAHRYPTAGSLALDLQYILTPPPPLGSESTVYKEGDAPADPGGRYQLRVEAGPALVGRTFAVPRGRFRIGRGRANDVSLPAPEVSRVHCGFIWNAAAGHHEVVDYGSKGGTFVNDERVRGRRRCRPGDRVRVVDYTLRLEPVPEGETSPP